MNNNFIKYNIHLVFWGTIAGLFSSIALFEKSLLILPGMILGGCMAYSLVLSNWWSRDRLSEGKPPKLTPILLSSLLMSTVALILVSIIYYLEERSGFYKNINIYYLEFGYYGKSSLMVYAFGVILPLAYRQRWRIRDSWKGRTLFALFLIALAGFICGFVRGFMIGAKSLNIDRYCIGYSIWGGLPYGLFWGFAVIKNDPAFSYELWRKIYILKKDIHPEELIDGGS